MAATIPDDLVDLLTSKVVATVAAHRPDGSIAMYHMWVDYDGQHVMISSRVGSRKAANWAKNPHVTLTVRDLADPWRFLVIRGRVVGTRADDGLAAIDRMSQRYMSEPYRRRDLEREIFLIEPDDVQARRGR